jgi:hypothetical protein
MPGLLFSSQTPLTISVIVALNKIGEGIFPCFAPLLILNHLTSLYSFDSEHTEVLPVTNWYQINV